MNKKVFFSSAKSETSEESISSSASKDSSKKTALEKNGWTMVEKEDLNKVSHNDYDDAFKGPCPWCH